MTDNSPNAKTGYRNPPSRTQFRKGQSGNPKGRPRKPKPDHVKFSDAPFSQQFEAEAYRLLTLQENGKAIELPASQALLRSIMVSALKGNNRLAQKQALELIREEEEKAAQRQSDRYHTYRELKKKGEAEINRCKEQSLPAPKLYPHPADILLDPLRREVHILGPLSEEEVPIFQVKALTRDYLIGLSIDLQSLKSRKSSIATNDYILAASQTTNQSLPPSMQYDEWAFTVAYMDWENLSPKERSTKLATLLKQINAGPTDVRTILKERENMAKTTTMLLDALSLGLDQMSKHLDNFGKGKDSPKT